MAAGDLVQHSQPHESAYIDGDDPEPTKLSGSPFRSAGGGKLVEGPNILVGRMTDFLLHPSPGQSERALDRTGDVRGVEFAVLEGRIRKALD